MTDTIYQTCETAGKSQKSPSSVVTQTVAVLTQTEKPLLRLTSCFSVAMIPLPFVLCRVFVLSGVVACQKLLWSSVIIHGFHFLATSASAMNYGRFRNFLDPVSLLRS